MTADAKWIKRNLGYRRNRQLQGNAIRSARTCSPDPVRSFVSSNSGPERCRSSDNLIDRAGLYIARAHHWHHAWLRTYARPSEMKAAMNTTLAAFLSCVLSLPFTAAQAESLRCKGGIASEGDSRLSLIYKCGQPLLADSFCAAVYYGPSPHPVPEPFASTVLPCQVTEQWLYERGPGDLLATVTLRAGKVQSITYGRTPQ